MDPSLSAAASGMKAQQIRVEVIANNLSNVNTTAFKRSRAHFEELLYQTLQGPARVEGAEARTVHEVQVGRGTRLATIQRVDGQGSLESTGRTLDLAIEGEGFFQVQLPDGSLAYTRDGSFDLSDRGMLVTHGGYGLLPGIAVPPDATSLAISRTGVVTAVLPEAPEGVEVGRLELARFPNPAGLRALGENLYQETSSSGRPTVGFPQDAGFGRILQGVLEGSNVEVVQEMVEMISALRAYELSAKAVTTSEQMAETANSLIR